MSAQTPEDECHFQQSCNANSTETAEGGPYRRKDVVFKATELKKFGEELNSALDRKLRGVRVSRMVQDRTPFV